MVRLAMSCFTLHNVLRVRYPTGQVDDFGAEGHPQIVLEDNDFPHHGTNPSEAAKAQRDIVRVYFMNEGQLPSQMDRI